METKHFRKNFALTTISVVFIILFLARIFFVYHPGVGDYNIRIWAMFYNIVALIGAFFGFYLSGLWGGYKSVVGRAVLAFSIGLLLQSFGQNVYNYIYFTQGFDIQPPYPGLGDLGFFGSVLFYIYGVFVLAKTSGVRICLNSFVSKIQAVIIPLALLLLSYSIFLKDYVLDWTNPVRIFLDFGYPLGQAFYVSVAILVLFLSRKVLGGVMKRPTILFIFALICQYLSDFIFLYQNNKGTFVVGCLVDCMYFISYFIMSLAIIQLGYTFNRIKNS